MDLNFLPEILSFLIIIGCFRPLARRAGPHVNRWFLGFGFLVAFLAASMFLPPGPAGPLVPLLLSRWSIDLAALTFLSASANRVRRRFPDFLVALLALPVLLQSSVAALAPHSSLASHFAGTLFALPAGFILFAPERRRTPQLFPLATACALLASAAWLAPPVYGILFSRFVISVLLLAAAHLYATTVPRISRSAVATVGGMIAWGLMTPAVHAVRLFRPGFLPNRALIEIPVYFMCGGVLLALLEEHVLRTERMAMHDPLTDLPNRRLFDERLEAALEDARMTGTNLACLVIDVDNFKTVNDTLGHDAGDQLLRALAVRLAWHMGPRDLLARTGGDEFTAMLAGVHSEDHLRYVAAAMMSAAGVPILIDNELEVDVRISIGIAISPRHAEDTETLRRAADDAMYAAKRRGGSLLAVAGEE